MTFALGFCTGVIAAYVILGYYLHVATVARRCPRCHQIQDYPIAPHRVCDECADYYHQVAGQLDASMQDEARYH